MTVVIALSALLIGIAFGVVMSRIHQKDNNDIEKLQEELDAANRNLQDYQDQVTEHFIKSSQLFGEMTETYQNVHQHLSLGAQNLCKAGTEAGMLEVSFKEQLTSAPALTDEHPVEAIALESENTLDDDTTEDKAEVDASPESTSAGEEENQEAVSEREAITADAANSEEESQDVITEKEANTEETAELEEEIVAAAEQQPASEQDDSEIPSEVVHAKVDEEESRPPIH